jgi:hypothetical protein
MPETLTLRPTFIAGDDDYQVFWRGLPVARIMRTGGVPSAGPLWWWGCTLPGRPLTGGDHGTCESLDDCEAAFKVAWDGIRSGLTHADIAKLLQYAGPAPRR